VREGLQGEKLKTALAYALRVGWARDEARWLRMLEARNLSALTYDQRIAEELAGEIPGFVPALRVLATALDEAA